VFLLLIQLLMLFFPFDYFLKPAYIFFIHDYFFKARVSLREHEVRFTRFARSSGLIHKDNFPEYFRVSSGWNPE